MLYRDDMKLDKDLESQFSAQITLELESSIAYRQLAIEADILGLPGAASWLAAQADEEVTHANKFINHLTDRDNHPVISDIPGPDAPAQPGIKGIFEAALSHEEKVSASIRKLVLAAEAAGDLDSRPLLNDFLTEQIEEEATVRAILDRIALVGDDGSGFIGLDNELGAREPTVDTPED